MNRQDGLQLDINCNNLISYAHGQLCLEHAGQGSHYLGGSLQKWTENKSSANFHGFGSGDAGFPVQSLVDVLSNRVGFTDVAAPRGSWRHFEEEKTR
jgi:hypothetical protein